tara:strand:- start:105309 stop:105623 length:315 start_codon:yes stop_codon:yes gene_type:complete
MSKESEMVTTRVTHSVKIHAPYFELLAAGKKTFEIRFDDRAYQEGDRVVAREVEWLEGERDAYGNYMRIFFTGRCLTYTIGHITDYKQLDGYVVWSCHDVEVVA